MTPIEAIIFDFDGVIADSEALANRVIAERVTALGVPTTLDDALHRYQGRRWGEAMALIEADIGRPLPPGFSEDVLALLRASFRSELREVPGASAFIHRFAGLRRCIASSSALARLQHGLKLLKLAEHFPDAVFSAEMVARGKPHPDIFFHAAKAIGVAPARCLVIEDSANGVEAAVAAGMTVVGLCAGAHSRDGHGERLVAAGAAFAAASWNEVEAYVMAQAG
jgi:HAD superfamily hydrolase (TIGR01509 family)